jgi:hypothetical protein
LWSELIKVVAKWLPAVPAAWVKTTRSDCLLPEGDCQERNRPRERTGNMAGMPASTCAGTASDSSRRHNRGTGSCCNQMDCRWATWAILSSTAAYRLAANWPARVWDLGQSRALRSSQRQGDKKACQCKRFSWNESFRWRQRRTTVSVVRPAQARRSCYGIFSHSPLFL